MFSRVIIVGRSNVGKSSLFNAIIGKKFALVDNHPGITRDVKIKEVSFLDKQFLLLDSAGIKESTNDLDVLINDNSLKYYKKSDIILFVIDGKETLTSEDHNLVKILRKINKIVITVINKTEGKINNFIINETEKLGFGKPVLISSAHNQGIDSLKFLIYEKIDTENFTDNYNPDFSIAIIGKVNSGKSTLINSLGNNQVSLTSSVPNLTRDSVEIRKNINDHNMKIFDTAGFFKSEDKKLKINKLSIDETLRKIRLCQIVLIVMDISDFYERIHSKIIDLVFNENRCLIVVVNKIDNLKSTSHELVKKKIYELNPQIKDLPIFFISALKKIGLQKLLNGITSQINCWKKRINTGTLNTWLKKTIDKNPPPLFNGNTVKFKYVMQVDTGPPKFNIFTNYPRKIKEPYKRYIANRLKENFKLNGLPVKIIYKKTSNPYEK